MDDTQANWLKEQTLKECPLKKANPTIEEIHSTLSTPYNNEFRDMGLFIEKNLVDDKSLDCIKSKFTDGRNRKIKEIKNGYVIYDPI